MNILQRKVRRIIKFLGIFSLSLGMLLFTGRGSLIQVQSAFAKCCSVVSINNFSELVGLIANKISSEIIRTIVDQIGSLMEFVKQFSQLQGVLTEEDQTQFEGLYVNTYNNLVSHIQDNAKNPEKWLKSSQEIVPPFVGANGISHGAYDSYGVFVQGDLSIIHEAAKSLDISSNSELAEHFKIRIRELESAKVALSQEVAEVGASAAKFQQMTQLINRFSQKIDSIQGSGNYNDAQAIKDLVKVQMVQTQLLLELLRNQINQENIMIAHYNQQLANERNKIINDMSPYFLSVSGTDSIFYDAKNKK